MTTELPCNDCNCIFSDEISFKIHLKNCLNNKKVIEITYIFYELIRQLENKGIKKGIIDKKNKNWLL